MGQYVLAGLIVSRSGLRPNDKDGVCLRRCRTSVMYVADKSANSTLNAEDCPYRPLYEGSRLLSPIITTSTEADTGMESCPGILLIRLTRRSKNRKA